MQAIRSQAQQSLLLYKSSIFCFSIGQGCIMCRSKKHLVYHLTILQQQHYFRWPVELKLIL